MAGPNCQLLCIAKPTHEDSTNSMRAYPSNKSHSDDSVSLCCDARDARYIYTSLMHAASNNNEEELYASLSDEIRCSKGNAKNLMEYPFYNDIDRKKRETIESINTLLLMGTPDIWKSDVFKNSLSDVSDSESDITYHNVTEDSAYITGLLSRPSLTNVTDFTVSSHHSVEKTRPALNPETCMYMQCVNDAEKSELLSSIGTSHCRLNGVSPLSSVDTGATKLSAKNSIRTTRSYTQTDLYKSGRLHSYGHIANTLSLQDIAAASVPTRCNLEMSKKLQMPPLDISSLKSSYKQSDDRQTQNNIFTSSHTLLGVQAITGVAGEMYPTLSSRSTASSISTFRNREERDTFMSPTGSSYRHSGDQIRYDGTHSSKQSLHRLSASSITADLQCNTRQMMWFDRPIPPPPPPPSAPDTAVSSRGYVSAKRCLSATLVEVTIRQFPKWEEMFGNVPPAAGTKMVCFVPPQTNLTGEDVSLTFYAVQSLYVDKLHPTFGMFQQRLSELVAGDGPPGRDSTDVNVDVEGCPIIASFLDVVRLNSSLMTIEEHPTQEEKVMIRLRHEPELKSDKVTYFVDAMDTNDQFSVNEWRVFFSYFYERMRAVNFRKKREDSTKAYQLLYQHRGGRYGLGKSISKANIPELEHLSIGHLCHMVQLARDRGVLVYEANVMEMRCGSQLCSEIFAGRLPSTRNSQRNKVLWMKLQQLLKRFVDPFPRGALLANLKKDFKEKMGFGFAIQEFGYRSLSALLTSEQLRDRYTLWQDGRGGVFCVSAKYASFLARHLRPFMEKRKDGIWPEDKPFWEIEPVGQKNCLSYYYWSQCTATTKPNLDSSVVDDTLMEIIDMMVYPTNLYKLYKCIPDLLMESHRFDIVKEENQNMIDVHDFERFEVTIDELLDSCHDVLEDDNSKSVKQNSDQFGCTADDFDDYYSNASTTDEMTMTLIDNNHRTIEPTFVSVLQKSFDFLCPLTENGGIRQCVQADQQPFVCYVNAYTNVKTKSLPVVLPSMISRKDGGPRQLSEQRFSTMEFQKYLLRVAETGVDESRECWALCEDSDYLSVLSQQQDLQMSS